MADAGAAAVDDRPAAPLALFLAALVQLVIDCVAAVAVYDTATSQSARITTVEATDGARHDGDLAVIHGMQVDIATLYERLDSVMRHDQRPGEADDAVAGDRASASVRRLVAAGTGYRSGYVGPGGFGIGGVLLIVLVVWILFYGGIPMHFRY